MFVLYALCHTVCDVCVVFCFFKQKTAYEMRISDWSSDVCSSDLVPSLTIGEGGQRSLSYTAVSVFERLFETDEGARAQDAWHQSIWPGEKGLEFMTGTDKNLYFGGKRPKGQLTARSNARTTTGSYRY